MNSDESKKEDGGAMFDADPELTAFRIDPSISAKDAKFPGAQVLAGTAPNVVLERLWDGDPLGISKRCLERMEDQAILLDPMRVLNAAMARVAHDAYFYAGDPELGTWLEQGVDKAIALLIHKATVAELRGDRVEEGEVPFAGAFTRILGVEPALVRRALLHFHTLDLAVRRTFCAVLVRGTSTEAWAATAGASVEVLEGQLLLAVETMASPKMPVARAASDDQGWSAKTAKRRGSTNSSMERRKKNKQERKRRKRGGGHA